jgi:hypothetical protein
MGEKHFSYMINNLSDYVSWELIYVGWYGIFPKPFFIEQISFQYFIYF